MSYTYSLEKGSKKHQCPQCQKKRYVRFVNNETNEYADYNFGRCDRETSCGYFSKPSHNSISTYNIPLETKKVKPISVIDNTIPKTTFKQFQKNNFYLFLKKHFDEESILNTFNKYLVGTSKKWDGSTVFWQKDLQDRFRAGKIMLFNATTGKRVRQPYVHVSWAHVALRLEDYNLKQCLYGLHLTTDKNKIIGLVESEKTAITMNLFLPNCNWLANGGKQNLKEELLNPIKDFKIIAYPDKSEFNDWKQKCDDLVKKGFDISCSRLVEKCTVIEGSDLADIYFDLETKKSKNINLSKTEELAQKLYSKNSSIKSLIETFDLTDLAGNEIKTNFPKGI